MNPLQSTESLGMLEVSADAPIVVDGTRLAVDFTDLSSRIDVNGASFAAETVGALAFEVERHFAGTRRLLSMPCDVRADGSLLVFDQAREHVVGLSGAYLSGASVGLAIDKAEQLATGDHRAWGRSPGVTADDLTVLDDLAAAGQWGGPLVVSMPRTGSTLLGTLFLLLRDPPGTGEHAFARYVHEPCAPVFWEGAPPASVRAIIGDRLTGRDLVQESAYQFADPKLALWFLRNARAPVVFVVRHPQLSWPSRWRIMLSMMLAEGSAGGDAERVADALAADDFTGIGDVLARLVRPADNGWYSFVALLGACVAEGIEFVVVDNARFRQRPEAVLGEVCTRWGVAYDDALATWRDLSDALPRVVMGDLARGVEYPWYYEGTMSSAAGIVRTDRPPVPADAFPAEFRGSGGNGLTIDEAVTWYHLLLARPETIG